MDFKGAQGDSIDGLLTNKGKNVIILCHGLLGNKNSLFFEEFAEKSSISTFRFDFPLFNNDKVFRYGSIHKDIDDLIAIHSQLVEKGFLVVGLIGHSRGADVVLHAALKLKLNFVISLAARFVMKNAMEKHSEEDLKKLEIDGKFLWKAKYKQKEIDLEITKEQFEDFYSLNNSLLKEIPQSTKVLLVHGKKDRRIPFEDLYEFQRVIKHSEILEIDGTDHIFRNKTDFLLDFILDWIKNQ